MGSFMAEVTQGTDRAAALALGTLVEDALELALRRAMRPLSRDEDDGLFGADAPAGTFSAKTKLAYALQLIDATARSDINYIREIRNAFAHTRMGLTFQTEEVKNVCFLLRWLNENTDLPSVGVITHPLREAW